MNEHLLTPCQTNYRVTTEADYLERISQLTAQLQAHQQALKEAKVALEPVITTEQTYPVNALEAYAAQRTISSVLGKV